MWFIIGALLFYCASPKAFAKTPGEEFTSLLGFALDRQLPLAQIANALGPAPLTEAGDAGDYEASLCYKSKNGFVQFLSGEMGGLDHDLYGFALSKNAPEEDCPDLPEKLKARDLKLGDIHLGMSRDAFIKTVGGDVRGGPLDLTAVFEYKRPMTVEERKRLLQPSGGPPIQETQDYLDGDISVEGMFSTDGLLYYVRVWKVETY